MLAYFCNECFYCLVARIDSQALSAEAVGLDAVSFRPGCAPASLVGPGESVQPIDLQRIEEHSDSQVANCFIPLLILAVDESLLQVMDSFLVGGSQIRFAKAKFEGDASQVFETQSVSRLLVLGCEAFDIELDQSLG